MGRLIGYLVFIAIMAFIGTTFADCAAKDIGAHKYEQKQRLDEI